jgi:predicted transposase/invertase (TIGR01784 family)
VTFQLNPAKTRMISQFVDIYLPLNSQEQQTFRQELDRLELPQKEKAMNVMTSWEKEGFDKGRIEERRAIALNLLNQQMPPTMIAQVTGLTLEQVQELQAQR